MNIVKKFVTISIAALISFGDVLTGCGSASASDPTHIVVVYGNHNNAPTPDLSVIEDQFLDAASTYGSITVVEDDGSPYIAVRETASKPAANISSTNRERKAKRFTAEVGEKIQTEAIPKTAEVNTIKAIQLGARELSDKSGKKILIIMDSCVSTTGALDLTQGYLENLNVDETISMLDSNKEIPDFSNVDEIVPYGIGDVSSPQKELGNVARSNLISLWEGIFAAGGCEASTCKSTVFSAEESGTNAEMPSVSTISVKENIGNQQYDGETSSEPLSFSDCDIVEIPESTVAFIQDTADFQDVDSSKATLEPLAKTLKEDALKCILIGMTATYGEADSAKTLSKQRAEAVSGILQQLGVSKEQVICIGTGYDSTPFHVQDTDENGNLDESLAVRNRCVLAVSVENKIAAEIVEKYS